MLKCDNNIGFFKIMEIDMFSTKALCILSEFWKEATILGTYCNIDTTKPEYTYVGTELNLTQLEKIIYGLPDEI